MNLTDTTLPSSPLFGAVWETFVFAELRKRISFSERPVDLWFYRDQRAREIDLVIDHGGSLSFVEIKWTENPGLEDAKTVLAVSRELSDAESPWKPGRHFVIGKPAHPYDLSAGLTAIGPSGLDRVLG